MRTPTVSLVGLFLFCVLAPRPAYAWFGDGWIEKLSGPGPFRGFNIDLRLVCLASPDARRDPAVRLAPDEKTTKEMLDDNSVGKAGTFPHDGTGGAFVTLFGCHFLPRDEPRLELGFQYSRLSAKGEENLLDYSHVPGVTAQDKDVRFHSVMLTADLRVNRVMDLGATIGRGEFSSPGGLFTSFSKLVFQPVRVTVRPLSTVMKNNRLVEALLIRGEGTMFKGGFTDAEFGARPGSFVEPGEIVWGWSIVFDISTLFWAR